MATVAGLAGDSKDAAKEALLAAFMERMSSAAGVTTPGEAPEISEEELELRHFQKVAMAYRSYKKYFLARCVRKRAMAERPLHHRQLLAPHIASFDRMQKCIEANDVVLRMITKAASSMFENAEYDLEKEAANAVIKDCDMSRLETVLRQLVRDWSAEGEVERCRSYKPVLDAVTRLFPLNRTETSQEDVRILVPGCGLSRLAWDLANLGYTAQGNEFSAYMLFASSWILNKTTGEAGEFTIYPYVHDTCNVRKTDDLFIPVKIPDVNPRTIPPGADFSMTAGDFIEVYTEPESWDCVATVFFLDTTHNVIDYLEAIYRILVPGGCLMSLGPLLYHYADVAGEESIELSYEELRTIMESLGFVIEEESFEQTCHYVENPYSLLQYNYRCVFFVARKPFPTVNSTTGVADS